MVGTGGFFTRFSIFLWCGIGFLFVSLRHILMNGYNHRAGFMLLLSLALFAAAFTDRQKRKLRAWREEEKRKVREEKTGPSPPPAKSLVRRAGPPSPHRGRGEG